MKTILVFAALCAAGAAHAVGVSPAIIAATAGANSASRARAATAPTPSPATGLCFWQVPGQMRWINLGHVAFYEVRPERNGVSHSFRLKVPGFDALEIGLPASTPNVQEIPNNIAQRIAECAAGG